AIDPRSRWFLLRVKNSLPARLAASAAPATAARSAPAAAPAGASTATAATAGKTSSSSSAAAEAAFRLRPRLIHVERPPVQSVTVESGDRLIGFAFIFHFNERKTAGPAGFAIRH